MKTCLVTGAAGFIGSALARHLIAEGHRVIIIDNLSTGSRNNLPKEALFIEGNCQDAAILSQLAGERLDIIFHLAGQSSGEVSFDDPVYDLQTNTQSTLMLLDLCLISGCRNMVYASSMSVYGQVGDEMIDEEHPTVPLSFYGVGKLASEHYLRLYSEQGVGVTALRLFNVYGPGQNMTNMRQGMVSIFLAQALSQGSIHVKGSKDRFRDFIYIDDVVQSFVKSAEANRPGTFRLLNICSGRRTTVEALADLILAGLGRSLPIRFEGTTPGDQYGIYGNPERAEQILDWTAETTLETGLDKMIGWAKLNMP